MAAPGNVLFVTIDQLRADVLDGALAGLAPLPTLDRLRREGAFFADHWTATVPCGPSRASLMTGLYAFNHRAVRNGAPLARHHATLGTEARKLGIEPLLFGYGDSAPDPEGRHSNDPDLRDYELPTPGFREIVEMRQESGFAWPGFLRAQGYDVPSPWPERYLDLYRPTGAGRISDPALYAAEHSDTAFLTDRTLEALDIRRDRPWFAHVAYIRPHPPLVAPDPWNRLVDPARVPDPAAAPDGQPHPFRAAWFSAPAQKGLFHGFDGNFAAMAPDTVRALRAIYLGLAAEVDHHLGRLIDWLDRTGQASRTLVVVTADHGEMLGDQGFWGKDTVLAPAHRAPLLIRDPRRPGARRLDAITSSVDVAPTILDWLGGTPPPAMDGASLLPFLTGADPAWRDAALTEVEFAEPHRETRFQRAWTLPADRCNAAVLRDAGWTLAHFNGGLPPMLFDRREDPGETRDLAGEPGGAAQIARLRTAMLDLRMTRADRRLTGFAFGA
jgi:arylsulfatase A-like enzyme